MGGCCVFLFAEDVGHVWASCWSVGVRCRQKIDGEMREREEVSTDDFYPCALSISVYYGGHVMSKREDGFV